MFTVNKAEYVCSAAWQSQWPQDDLPEVLLAGRSNVGKSSFINAITNVKGLAKVSSKPGKTRTLNFFNINDDLRIVDVPGYGYAKVSEAQQAQFGEMFETYVQNRTNFKGMVLLVDYRHPPKEDDITMYDYAKYYDIPVIIVATKEDKLKRNDLIKNEKRIKRDLNIDPNDTFLRFSIFKPECVDQVWQAITKLCF